MIQHSLPTTALTLAVALLASTSQAQDPSRSKAEARAEARATANGKDTSHSSQTVTHRVVVENGVTVVDEKTVNGVPVRGHGRAVRPMPPMPPLGGDAEEMLRRMREQLDSRSKAEARAEARATANGKDTSHSSQTVTHRVVVENGVTVVDEKTVNGVPVRGHGCAVRPMPPMPPLGGDAEEMLRRMREQLERDMRKGPLKKDPARDRERARDSVREKARQVIEKSSGADRKSGPGTRSDDRKSRIEPRTRPRGTPVIKPRKGPDRGGR